VEDISIRGALKELAYFCDEKGDLDQYLKSEGNFISGPGEQQKLGIV